MTTLPLISMYMLSLLVGLVRFKPEEGCLVMVTGTTEAGRRPGKRNIAVNVEIATAAATSATFFLSLVFLSLLLRSHNVGH